MKISTVRTGLWRIIHHYVDEARGRADYSDVTRVAGAGPRAGQGPDPWDETAARRGHNYVSLFIDLDCRRVLFATEGKSLPSGLTQGMPRLSPPTPRTWRRMAGTPRRLPRCAST